MKKVQWAEKAKLLRESQPGKPIQEDFARRLGLSTSEVRRWEQGARAPTPAQAIKLGQLAGHPECWYWWELAGLAKRDALAALEAEASLIATKQSIDIGTALRQIIEAGLSQFVPLPQGPAPTEDIYTRVARKLGEVLDAGRERPRPELRPRKVKGRK